MTSVVPAVWTVYKSQKMASGDVGVVKSGVIYNADGTLKDLTGLTLQLEVWDGDPAQPLLQSPNVADDGTPSDGVVNWTVSAPDLAALPVRPDGLFVAIRTYVGLTYQDTTDPFVLLVKSTV